MSTIFTSLNFVKYRFDLVFSYWIFTWYILYMLKIIPYNPKLVLIIGILENSLGLLFGYFYNLDFSWNNFFGWLSINFWIKLVPLYTVWNTKIHLKQDFIHFIKAFCLYGIWCFISGRNVFIQHMKIAGAFKKGSKPKGDITPAMLLIYDLRQWFKKI